MTAHVLIVEDDLLSQEVLTRLLDTQQATYSTVNNPATLEDMLPDLPPVDAVFLDLEMPHLDGYEVLAILKAHYGSSVPMIAYTVHTSEANTAMEMGFDSFLAKPLNSDVFQDQFQRILNGEKVWITR